MPDCSPPPDPLGSQRDLHVTGLTGVLTLTILVVLQETVFKRDPVPADIMFWISPAASYLASMLSGRRARKRLLVASQTPEAASPAVGAGEAASGP